MRLQYRLSNGNWVDCNDRTDEFLTWCENWNVIVDGKTVQPTFPITPASRNDVVAALESGIILRNDGSDWYSQCRDGEYVDKKNVERLTNMKPVELVKCSCGHTIPKNQVMSASLGTSCSDCYDRMSV